MEPLQYGKYYHIYNRGNNREDLFRTSDNYRHFLYLYDKYISPVAETFAWVMMRNHFHLLVRVKEVEQISAYKLSNDDGSKDPLRFQDEKWETLPNLSASEGSDSVKHLPHLETCIVPGVKRPNPILHFSHLFNAYARYFNTLYSRSGTLFETPFKRIPVNSNRYFRHLIVYIHTNPVHHGFTKDFKDYAWSSYGSILSVKPTKLSRDIVLGWFDDKTNFFDVHNNIADMDLIRELLIE